MKEEPTASAPQPTDPAAPSSAEYLGREPSSPPPNLYRIFDPQGFLIGCTSAGTIAKHMRDIRAGEDPFREEE